MKVYGGLVIQNMFSRRGVLATTSFRQAQKILKCSRTFFKSYWSEVEDVDEKVIARSNPEKICVKMDDGKWWFNEDGEWRKAVGEE